MKPASKNKARLIAFYLPQYHPIPENDAWWGKGFTEWTNVAKAKPLFPGHYQPHLPADLGFYDLRLPEARQAQAELAQEYGIEGFCYYHYWFNGRRLLELPFNEVLSSRRPSLPFCLCWANENWTRVWDGGSREILVAQEYSDNNDRLHIRWLAKAFQDARYMRVNGKPLFLVYRANQIPDPLKTTSIWREEARRLGVGELFLARVESFPDERGDIRGIGFDAAVEFQPDCAHLGTSLWVERGGVFSYAEIVEKMLAKPLPSYRRFPCVTPFWDNSPRRQNGAAMLHGSTPELYGRWLRDVLQRMPQTDSDDNVVFLNAWNEWAEGCHLEPCQKWGRAYLEATQRALTEWHQADSLGSEALQVDLTDCYDAVIRRVYKLAEAYLSQTQQEMGAVTAKLAITQAQLSHLHKLQAAAQDMSVLPASESFIFVDEGQLGRDFAAASHAIPFLERNGHYWGPPPDDETAIRELERLKCSGALFIVFAWTAFWWLDYYSGFRQHLRENYYCPLENERLIIFDLRSSLSR